MAKFLYLCLRCYKWNILNTKIIKIIKPTIKHTLRACWTEIIFYAKVVYDIPWLRMLSFFSLSFFFLYMHSLSVAYFLCRIFFSRLFFRLYLSFFVCFRYAIIDSVHILSAFSTIIFPFAVLCFYCLLLFFFLGFFFVFRCQFFVGFRFPYDIGKTHYVRFCYRRLTLALFFCNTLFEMAICMCILNNIQQSQNAKIPQILFHRDICTKCLYSVQICDFQPPLTIHL